MFLNFAETVEGDLMVCALMAEAEPVIVEKALPDNNWKAAMEEELREIQMNNTCELLSLPEKKSPIEVKSVFKTKIKPNGDVAKNKAKLVAKGFQ